MLLHVKSHDQYEAACNASEIWVDVRSAVEHGIVLRTLKYDKSGNRHGGRGRVLANSLSLGNDRPELTNNDRLEPHQALQDVGRFDKLVSFPVWILFLEAISGNFDKAHEPTARSNLEYYSRNFRTGHFTHPVPGLLAVVLYACVLVSA